MELFIVDAFANKIFEGNQAGVVLLNETDSFPDDNAMRKIAAELKHSETVFVKTGEGNAFSLRYFTPESEVDLCGHATISAFTVMREEGRIKAGEYVAETLSGDLKVLVEADCVWLTMPQGKIVRELTGQESNELYHAFYLDPSDRPDAMRPTIVCVGLPDILMPVASKERLDGAVQNRAEVIRLTRDLVVGVHSFCYLQDQQPTAYCRNFAPLFGIDEESATGTSNASLTYYLNRQGMIQRGRENTFIQGEAMGKPSVIRSRMDENGTIRIGGTAVISVRGKINFAV